MNKLVLVLPVALLFGCADLSKQQLGTATGAALGGLLGNQVGRGTGRVLATAAGAAVGGYVGNRIGKNLDEQDRKRLSDATLKTAETGRTQSVVSASTGAIIRTEPVAAPVARKPATASQPAPATRAVQAPSAAAASGTVATASDSSGGECKLVRQTVSLRNGDKQEEDVRLCKGPNGWEIADA